MIEPSPILILNPNEGDIDLQRRELAAEVELATLRLPWSPSSFRYKEKKERYNSLHHQLVLNRKIVLTERPELHLTISKKVIFLKPLPKFMFHRDFLNAHVARNQARNGSACGMFLSYVFLINHETDLRIAHSHYLLPEDISWAAWALMVENFLLNARGVQIPRRYLWGELETTSEYSLLTQLRLGLRLPTPEPSASIPAETEDWVSVRTVLEAIVTGRAGTTNRNFGVGNTYKAGGNIIKGKLGETKGKKKVPTNSILRQQTP
jgi:hypothetical protein